MQNKHYVRLDEFVNILNEIASDEYFKYTRSRTCLSTTKVIRSRIRSQHSNSLCLKETIKIDDFNFIVTSQKTLDIYYLITRTQQECQKCSLKCPSCNACPHLFKCSCISFKMHNSCKHIHAVQSFLYPNKTKKSYPSICIVNNAKKYLNKKKNIASKMKSKPTEMKDLEDVWKVIYNYVERSNEDVRRYTLSALNDIKRNITSSKSLFSKKHLRKYD